MKRPNLITYAALVVLVALLSGCSASEENSGSSNTNAVQTTNSNAAPQPQIGQGNPANAAPPSVQPIPAPAPGEKSKVAGNADAAATPASTDNPRAPKLVIPAKKVDFGKQPQDKTLVRAIVVKNGGREDLKIESVVPSWGCTTVDFPKVLRPGQAGSIKVKVETGKSPGPHTKSVTIKSNDPADPSHIVQFSFDVKG